MPTKEKKEYYIKNGRCVNCGNKQDRHGFYCTRCIESKRLRSIKARKKYKENEQCTRCGTPLPTPEDGRKDCPGCTLKPQPFTKLFR